MREKLHKMMWLSLDCTKSNREEYQEQTPKKASGRSDMSTRFIWKCISVNK